MNSDPTGDVDRAPLTHSAGKQSVDNLLHPAVNHVYEPLSQPTEIRVALIEPSMDETAPLRFSFHQNRLEDLEGRYEALSYVWGKPILEFPIHHVTDGSRLLVTKNLNQALQRLRHKVDVRWLWADAICINQRDNQEKACQIPLMVDIFRGAKRVLAWLHSGDDAIERGMRYIDSLSRHFHSPGLSTTREHAVAELLPILNLPYFRRLWIVQELVFSLDIVLICGTIELSWLRWTKSLAKLQKWFELEHVCSHSSSSALQTVVDLWWKNWSLTEAIPVVHKSSSGHMFDLVLEFHTYECTDARDRIFAVQALSHGGNAQIEIDYDLGVSETYCRFARACMADGRTLDVLDAAIARLNGHSTTDVPSWAPDWTRKPSVFARLDEGRGDSMVSYYGQVDHKIIELDVQWLNLHDYKRQAEKEIPNWWVINMDPVAVNLESVLAVFADMVCLYKESDIIGVRDVHTLWENLTRLWNMSKLDIDTHKFFLLLHRLWSTPEDCPVETEGWLQSFAEVISDYAGGCCFFTARSSENNNEYFAYGSPGLVEGDQIILTEQSDCRIIPEEDFVYHAIVLRLDDQIAKEAPSRCQTAEVPDVYRLVGKAWMMIQTRKYKSSKSAVPIRFSSAHDRIYLC